MFFSDIVYSVDSPAAGFNKVRPEKVSGETLAHRRRSTPETPLTVEQGVGDQSTGVDDFVTLDGNWFASAASEVLNCSMFPLQLVSIQTVYISSMVLVEIRELVVEQDRRVQIRRHVELNHALRLRTQSRAGVLDEGVLRWVVLGLGIPCAELVAVLRDVDQGEGGEGFRRLNGVAVCILEGHFRNLKIG